MRTLLVIGVLIVMALSAILLWYLMPRYEEVSYKVGDADIFVVIKSTQTLSPTPFRLYYWLLSNSKDDDLNIEIVQFTVNGTELAKYDFISSNADTVVDAVRERDNGILYIQGGVRGAKFVLARPISENRWNPPWPFSISFDGRNQVLEVWKNSKRLEIGLTNR